MNPMRNSNLKKRRENSVFFNMPQGNKLRRCPAQFAVQRELSLLLNQGKELSRCPTQFLLRSGAAATDRRFYRHAAASGCGTVGNAVCGDIMRVYLDIDENNVIQDAKFKTFGCGAAIATSSMATVLVKGKTVQEALKVTNKAVMEALDGLPPVKVHCSLLAEEAIHAALWDYAEKNGIVIEGLEKPVSDISEHDHGHDDEDDE